MWVSYQESDKSALHHARVMVEQLEMVLPRLDKEIVNWVKETLERLENDME